MGETTQKLGVSALFCLAFACGDNTTARTNLPTISIDNIGDACMVFASSICDRIETCGTEEDTFGPDCEPAAFDFCCQENCAAAFSGTKEELDDCADSLVDYSCEDIVNYYYPVECIRLLE